ncbi:hypothetical protein Belba_0291 [Belliella baltica DSM 15883]|uniref:Outer membrane porin, OprD family n=1 Tax=Belliella baltica (strain DSM 15883 / CIP 108006 / LMG 21964 / BA134) TaxID=866536 RepID=I3Z138_BELBD|nr:hypothetical protein [Belliella baltica]AFL82956.1 hypothetical protein Belba_0291 [Belliella baltica DSM 15883]
MKKLIFFIGLLWSSVSIGQINSDSLKSSQKLKWTLGTRSFFMSTSYYDDFKNDFAWAQSAYAKVQTPKFKGFSFAGRYAVFGKILSSDLIARDPVTGGRNRYESGLLDVTDLERNYFGRLEEFQFKFNTELLSIAAGRMPINTALINPQDGRLSPTFVEGLIINFIPDKFNTATLNYISRISPRSTASWFGIGESIGLYPIGLDTDGNPSAYQGKVSSDFVTVFDWKHVVEEDAFSFEFNHTYVQNISSTFLTQFQRDWKLTDSKKLVSGLQIMFQHGIKNGGNENPALRYKDPFDENWIVGTRIGMKNPKSSWHLNFTYIGGKGRYLSPREWGKDPFFTFIPRERNEGFSEVTAMTAYYEKVFREKGLLLYGHAGMHFLPRPNTFSINKYAFPSYTQGNIGAKYTPKSWGAGLIFHALIMTKLALHNDQLRPGWVYNKVNLVHINLIANYTFQWK